MTPLDHQAEATRLLDLAMNGVHDKGSQKVANTIAAAHVHAMLARNGLEANDRAIARGHIVGALGKIAESIRTLKRQL